MRIGFISTRLSGSDGVSLEVAKWMRVLRRMGHVCFFCAGELGGYAADGLSRAGPTAAAGSPNAVFLLIGEIGMGWAWN